MAVSPDSKGVFLFGGLDANNLDEAHLPYFDNRISELRVSNKPWANSWNILNITLNRHRGTHVVIPLQ